MTPREIDAAAERAHAALGMPTTKQSLWDALDRKQRAAICDIAGFGQYHLRHAWAQLTEAERVRVWAVLERFSALSSRLVAANDAARAAMGRAAA